MLRAFAGLAVFLTLAASAAAADTKEVRRTVGLDSRGTVAIQTFKGSIDVETWSEPRAEIFASIEPDTMCGTAAQQAERVRLTEVDVDASPSKLSIRSDYDALKDFEPIPFHVDNFDASCNAHPYVRYRLRIPATARLHIEDHKSDINVSALQGDVRIQTHKGHVNVKGQDGAVELTTHKGDVHVEFTRLADSSRLETYKGDIEVTVPRRAGFDLDARVEGGGSLEAPFRLDEEQVGKRERVYAQKVNGGGPRLELTTRRGSLKIVEK
jgi:DUF4097 and DUF4098 domain-containing protein YvlB